VNFLKEKLIYEKNNGVDVGSEFLEIKSHKDLLVFNDLVNIIKKNCDASIEKEAGGAVYEEWIIFLKSRGREVTAGWNWCGITFSAGDQLGLEFLMEIEEIVKCRKYWKLQLLFSRFFG